MKLLRCSLCLVVALVFVAAGCGEGDGDAGPSGEPVPTPTDDRVEPSSIDGDWVLVSGHLAGEEIALVDGWDVTMSLHGDQIGGTAACNSYGGTVDVGDGIGPGGSFVVGELSWTEMGCEPEVMELEQQFLAALGEIDSYELADTLSLARADAATGLVFERVAPVEDRALVGTMWRLDTLLSGDAASNSTGMDAAFLVFSDDGTLAGSTGCRRLEGDWVLQGATIQIPILSAIDDPAAGACAPESEALDGDIIAVVESGTTVEVDGSRLTLTARGGDGLSFFADDQNDTDSPTDPDGDGQPSTGD